MAMAQQRATNPRGYITLDPAPMRRGRNPGWPWIAGGVVGGAALLGAAAWKCRAHVISDDLINLGEDTVYRRIQYKGCFQNLPYEVIVSMADPKRYLDSEGFHGMEEEFNAFVLLRSSFSSLKEAQRFGSENDEEKDEDRESNPSDPYAACMTACVSREGCSYRAGKSKAACNQQCQSECRGLAAPAPKSGGAPAPRLQASRFRRLAQRRVMRGR